MMVVLRLRLYKTSSHSSSIQPAYLREWTRGKWFDNFENREMVGLESKFSQKDTPKKTNARDWKDAAHHVSTMLQVHQQVLTPSLYMYLNMVCSRELTSMSAFGGAALVLTGLSLTNRSQMLTEMEV
jgi:hypothetical protein